MWKLGGSASRRAILETYFATVELFRPMEPLTWSTVFRTMQLPTNTGIAHRNVAATLMKERRERAIRENTSESHSPTAEMLRTQLITFLRPTGREVQISTTLAQRLWKALTFTTSPMNLNREDGFELRDDHYGSGQEGR